MLLQEYKERQARKTMIKANKGLMQITGNSVVIATEAAMLLKEIRKKSPQTYQAVLTCLYSDGGSRTLKDALEMFKDDTTQVLKNLEGVEKAKNG